jgi:hypothetical protein
MRNKDKENELERQTQESEEYKGRSSKLLSIVGRRRLHESNTISCKQKEERRTSMRR